MKIRPSMDKFPSPHRNIEVISWAKPIPAHLNRQLILILSDLGVAEAVFLNAQDEAMKRIESMKNLLEGGCSKADLNLQLDLLESTWRVRNKPESLPARAIRMMRAGFQPEQEPYLSSMCPPLHKNKNNKNKNKQKKEPKQPQKKAKKKPDGFSAE